MALPLFWMTSGGWSHASRHEAEWHTSQAPGKLNLHNCQKVFDFWFSATAPEASILVLNLPESLNPAMFFLGSATRSVKTSPAKNPFWQNSVRGAMIKATRTKLPQETIKSSRKKAWKKTAPTKGSQSLVLILLYCRRVERSAASWARWARVSPGHSVPTQFPNNFPLFSSVEYLEYFALLLLSGPLFLTCAPAFWLKNPAPATSPARASSSSSAQSQTANRTTPFNLPALTRAAAMNLSIRMIVRSGAR